MLRPILILLIVVLLQGFTPALGQQAPTGPTCASPTGTWHNDLGSTLLIESADANTGMLTGTYQSPSGGGISSYPLIGWVNDAPANASNPCSDCLSNQARALSLTVRWGEIGSITSWTGTCALVNEAPAIKMLWNLVRPKSAYSWDHVVSGSATFVPGPAPTK